MPRAEQSAEPPAATLARNCVWHSECRKSIALEVLHGTGAIWIADGTIACVLAAIVGLRVSGSVRAVSHCRRLVGWIGISEAGVVGAVVAPRC